MSAPAPTTPETSAVPAAPPGYRFLSRLPLPLLCWLTRLTCWHRLGEMLRFARQLRRHRDGHYGWLQALRLGLLRGIATEEHRAWLLACPSLAGRNLDRYLRTEGREHLDAARRAGRPLLLVMIHQMPSRLFQYAVNQPALAWEPWLARRDPAETKATVPYAEFFDRQRADSIWQGRVVATDTGGLRRFIRVLRAGGVGVISLDGAERPGASAPVLGRTLPYTLGTIRLAADSGARVLPFVIGTGFLPGAATIRYLPSLDPAGKTPEAWRAEMLHLLEQMILSNPEAWMEWDTWFRAGNIPS